MNNFFKTLYNPFSRFLAKKDRLQNKELVSIFINNKIEAQLSNLFNQNKFVFWFTDDVYYFHKISKSRYIFNVINNNELEISYFFVDSNWKILCDKNKNISFHNNEKIFDVNIYLKYNQLEINFLKHYEYLDFIDSWDYIWFVTTSSKYDKKVFENNIYYTVWSQFNNWLLFSFHDNIISDDIKVVKQYFERYHVLISNFKLWFINLYEKYYNKTIYIRIDILDYVKWINYRDKRYQCLEILLKYFKMHSWYYYFRSVETKINKNKNYKISINNLIIESNIWTIEIMNNININKSIEMSFLKLLWDYWFKLETSKN